jgi:hypothetical protein
MTEQMNIDSKREMTEGEMRERRFIESEIVRFIDIVKSDDYKQKKELVLNYDRVFQKIKKQFKLKNIKNFDVDYRDEKTGLRSISLGFKISSRIIVDTSAVPDDVRSEFTVPVYMWTVQYKIQDPNSEDIPAYETYSYSSYSPYEEDVIEEQVDLEDEKIFNQSVIDYVMMVDSDYFRAIKQSVNKTDKIAQMIKNYSKKTDTKIYNIDNNEKKYVFRFLTKESVRLDIISLPVEIKNRYKKRSEIWVVNNLMDIDANSFKKLEPYVPKYTHPKKNL